MHQQQLRSNQTENQMIWLDIIHGGSAFALTDVRTCMTLQSEQLGWIQDKGLVCDILTDS